MALRKIREFGDEVHEQRMQRSNKDDNPYKSTDQMICWIQCMRQWE